MSSLNDHQQEVIEIVEPANSQSIQNPLEPQNELQKDQNNIIEEKQTQRKQTQTKLSNEGNQTELKPSSDKKRKKIILYKCKVCKTTGKKSTVKMCSKCKFHFHFECIDPDKILDNSKPFICQICDKYSSTQIANHMNHSLKLSQISNHKAVSSKLPQNIIQQKQRPTNGFLNISKLNSIYQTNFKKEEWKRKLYEFYKKYPYCFQKNKIIFPIEDHLLHIYQSILPSYCKTTTPRPLPSFPDDGVPKKYYNQLMEIQAFFYHFWEDLKLLNFFRPQNKKYEKNIKIQQIKRKNLYQKFVSEGVSQLYAWILETLLRMYLNDIMDRNRIDNIKFIGLSPFFNLLAVINEDGKGLSKQFIIKLAPEIIKNLTKTPSFRHSFYCDYEEKQHHQLQYPKIISCGNKIKVITKLIHGLCDTDCFKEIVVKKSQQIGYLTKQKGENLQKLKSIENENIPLKQQIKQLENELKQLAFSDPKEYSKSYQTNNKKLQKLIMTHKQNLQKIEEYREKVKQVGRRMPFVNSAVKFLGVDRFKSEYFFYKNDNSRIYVKYRDSILDEENSQQYWCYSSKQEIQKLKNWLNSKGANQKGLLFNINSLEQKDLLIFTENSKKDQSNNSQNACHIEQQRRISELETITRQENLQTLIFCENLYKQTLQINETLLNREKEIEEIFEKLHSQNQKEDKLKIQLQNTQLSEHPLKALFSKYTSKLLHWNQKARRFWYEFLDIYTTEPNQQTQGNLFILTTIWKISMTHYHTQFMRKKQKIQKKKQKFKETIRQRETNNFTLRDSQFQQQQTSQNQQNSTPYSPQENQTRKLRKRQNRNKIQQKQDTTPDQSLYDSSKKQTSENQGDQKSQKNLPQSKTKNKPSAEEKRQSVSGKKSKNQKNKKKKKLQIESQSPSSSQKQQTSSQKLKKDPNQLLLEFQEKQVLPEEQFCEECFQNINHDKTLKIKVLRCYTCSKAYHKKCLNQDDALRLKKVQDFWECEDCSQKVQSSEVDRKTDKKSDIKNHAIENEQMIIPETVKVKSKIQEFNGKNKKGRINKGNQKQTAKKSKVTQKIEKKQKKIKEQKKKNNSQEINSESQQQYEQEVIKKRTKKNQNETIKKDDKNTRNSSQRVRRSTSRNSVEQSIKSQNQLNGGRLTRNKSNRKKIIEPQSSEQEPNSEEQENSEDQEIKPDD